MNATTPYQIDGKEYPLLGVNLAITISYNPNGTSNESVAIRLIPTRIENEEVEAIDSSAKSLAFSTAASVDHPTQKMIDGIQVAIQEFLIEKGV